MITTKLVGVSFENRQELLKKVSLSTKIKLIREKNNIHDKNAIGVLASVERFNKITGWTMTWVHIGYIPADLSMKLSPLADRGLISLEKVSILNLLTSGKKNSMIGIEIAIDVDAILLPIGEKFAKEEN